MFPAPFCFARARHGQDKWLPIFEQDEANNVRATTID
jgi:hypothetical protein